MNRREAVASIGALATLPGMASFKAELKSGDVIVMECPGAISTEVSDRLKAQMAEVWPNHKVIILSDGMRLNIISGV